MNVATANLNLNIYKYILLAMNTNLGFFSVIIFHVVYRVTYCVTDFRKTDFHWG